MSRTAKQMVYEMLVKYDYEGLYTDDCGCLLDDLMPCGEWVGDCKAGDKCRVPAYDGYGTQDGVGPREAEND